MGFALLPQLFVLSKCDWRLTRRENIWTEPQCFADHFNVLASTSKVCASDSSASGFWLVLRKTRSNQGLLENVKQTLRGEMCLLPPGFSLFCFFFLKKADLAGFGVRSNGAELEPPRVCHSPHWSSKSPCSDFETAKHSEIPATLGFLWSICAPLPPWLDRCSSLFSLTRPSPETRFQFGNWALIW